MNYFKIFQWEDGKIKKDYTEFLTLPIFYEEHLDETLDTAEVVLEAMPIKTKNDFPAKTKFRVSKYKNEDFSDKPENVDMVVEHDDVEEYVGVPEICTHRISLIEAGAVTQGMHVDNIALTYELQDVTLNYKTTRNDDSKVETQGKEPVGYITPIRRTDKLTFKQITNGLNPNPGGGVEVASIKPNPDKRRDII